MMTDDGLYYQDEMNDAAYLNSEYNHLYVQPRKVDHLWMDQVMYDDDDVICLG